MIRSGELKDWADAARAAGVTRARMTQIANLLLLAPEIQEALLLWNSFRLDELVPAERALRTLPLQSDWMAQTRRYRMLRLEV